MTRSKNVSMGHMALIPLLALTFALAACGGEDPSRIAEAEAAVTVAPVTPTPVSTVARTVPVVEPETPTFGTPEEAYKAGDYRAAKRLYETHLESRVDDGHGHYMLGLSSWKAGDFERAKVAFDKAIELTPTFAKAYFNQGRVLLDLGRPGEALEVIEKGRAIDSTSGEGLRLVARAQSEQGDIDGAIATYRELLTRDEDDAWGLNNLGMLYLDRGDVETALGPLARAVQVRPTAPLFLNNLGMALEKSGYPIAALHRYELAVQHGPDNKKAMANLERMKGAITDSTFVDEVSVQKLAEEFRAKVREWQQVTPMTVPVPVPDSVVVPVVVITP